jgi:putative peptidoglycan lipid II flippase
MRSRLLRDNLGVAAGTGLSRITGVARLGALYVAAGPSLRDAYVLANNTPNIIYELILGGILTATLVPLFTAQLEMKDDEGTSAVVSVAIIGLGALMVLAFVAAPLLIVLYGTNAGPGVDADTFRRVGITLSILFVPQVFFYGMMAIGTAPLHRRRVGAGAQQRDRHHGAPARRWARHGR